MRDHNRLRQKGLENLLDGDWAGARASTTVRSRKRFVQIEMHHVHTEISWTDLADQRVHVGAVHVKKAALRVENRGDFVDVLFEDAEGVGIREHQSCDTFV